MYLIIISCFIGVIGNVLLKIYSNEAREDTCSKFIYTYLMAAVSALAFAIGSGFNLPMTNDTYIYSAIYGAIIAVNGFLMLYVCKRVNLIVFYMIVTLSGLIIPTIFGIVYLKEPITVYFIIAAVLTLTAVVLPLMHLRSESPKEDKRPLSKKEKLFIALFVTLYLISSGLSAIVNKLTAIAVNEGRILSNFSFCFMTNIFMLGISVCSVIPYIVFKPKTFMYAVEGFTPKLYSIHIIKTLLSNVTALLSLLVLSKISLSYNQFATQSISQVLIFASTIIVFKTKPDKYTVISFVLELIAALVLFIPNIINGGVA